MQDLIESLTALAPNEGVNKTPLPGVYVFKASQSSGKIPLCYSQGVIWVAQGQKRVYFNESVYEYNPDNYLALAVPVPAKCDTIVEPGKPLLSLMIDFDMNLLNELVRIFTDHGCSQATGVDNTSEKNKGLFVSQCTDNLRCTIVRLAKCLQDDMQSSVLGKSLIREVFYHILKGPNAAPLFSLVSHNTHLSKMEKVLKHLHTHYSGRLDVEQLATMANMSASTFHRNFKQITASSPIQYIKKLRLSRARELLVDQGLKVKQAAAQVGYDSPTQFSREFTRYFGQSPSECNRQLA
ncbi:AraC family transcriptional regulator [Thalassotalea montiporae]